MALPKFEDLVDEDAYKNSLPPVDQLVTEDEWNQIKAGPSTEGVSFPPMPEQPVYQAQPETVTPPMVEDIPPMSMADRVMQKLNTMTRQYSDAMGQYAKHLSKSGPTISDEKAREIFLQGQQAPDMFASQPPSMTPWLDATQQAQPDIDKALQYRPWELTDVIKGVGQRFPQSMKNIGAGAAQMASEAVPLKFPAMRQRQNPIADNAAQWAQDAQIAMQQIRELATAGDEMAQFIFDSLSVTTDMGPALGLGMVAGPEATLYAMGMQAAAGTYPGRRQAGENPGQALLGSAYTGVIETVTEKIPIGALFSKGKPYVRKLLEVTLGEGLQEGASSLLQSLYDKATIRPDMTLGEALREAGYETTLGATAGATIATAMHPVQKAQEAYQGRQFDLGQPNLPDTDALVRQAMAPKQPAPLPSGQMTGEQAVTRGEYVQGMQPADTATYTPPAPEMAATEEVKPETSRTPEQETTHPTVQPNAELPSPQPVAESQARQFEIGQEVFGASDPRGTNGPGVGVVVDNEPDRFGLIAVKLNGSNEVIGAKPEDLSVFKSEPATPEMYEKIRQQIERSKKQSRAPAQAEAGPQSVAESKMESEPSEAVIQSARKVFNENKDIQYSLDHSARGVIVGAQSRIDYSFDERFQDSAGIPNAKQFYSAFDDVRVELRKQYGDTVTLYRYDWPDNVKIKNKHVLNFSTRAYSEKYWKPMFERYAKEDGRKYKLISKVVPIDDIAGVNVAKNGKYQEFIVLNPNSEGFVDPRNVAPAQAEAGPQSTPEATKQETPAEKPKNIPLMQGDRFKTASGRVTAPFPKTNYKSEKRNSRAVNEWLKQEYLAEARSRGDTYNETLAKGLDPGNWSQADGDGVNLYLFDDPEGRIGHLKVTPNQTKPAEKPVSKRGKVKAETPKAKPNTKAAISLRKQADTLTKTIEAKRHPASADQNPTPRRARIIGGMAKEADSLERLQTVMRGLADRIEAGEATGPLANISTKTEVEAVLRHEKMPTVFMHPRDLVDLLDAAKGLKGIADARSIVQSLQHQGEVRLTNAREIMAVDTLLKATDKAGKKVMKYSYARDSVADFKRIQKLGITDQAQWNDARKSLQDMAETKPKETSTEQKIKQIERDLIGNKIPGFFATPKPVIDQMMVEAGIEPDMKVLEPSAGAGDIAEALREAGADVETVERQGSLRELLELKGFKVTGDDFLQHKGKYDRIVMNPPFEKMADVDHVMHAFELLKPGGRLVAITSESPFFRQEKKAQDFRDFVDQNGYSEKLPADAFKKGRFRSTGVQSRLVVLDKPESGTMESRSGKTVSSWNPGALYVGQVNTAAIPEPAAVPAKPIRRADIIKRLEQRINMPIYKGRVKGSHRLGFYRTKLDEIRVKFRNDIETTAHEVAHFIDYNNPVIRRAYKKAPFNKELRGISYDSTKLHEGFAEFIRLWATQETEAVQRAPHFYDWFEQWVHDKANEPYSSAILEAKESMKAWYAQGALNRLKSNIGTTDEHFAQKLTAITDRFMDKRIGEVFDGLQGLKAAEIDLLGGLQEANESPYKSARNVAGARAIVKMILEEGTPAIDANGDLYFTGEGLKQVLEPVHNKLDDWVAYMVAMRARELRKQGREKLISLDEERAGLKLGQDPDIQLARNKYREFNTRMMDFYEQLGILSKESRGAMEAANQEYIPFNRVIETFDGKAKPRAGNPMKRLHGSDRNIADVIDSIASNIAVMTHRGILNRAKLLAYDMTSKSKNGARYAVKIPATSKKITIPVEEVRRAFLESLGMTPSMVEMMTPEMQQHFDWMFSGMQDLVQYWVHGQAPIGKNIDSVMRNGKLEYYEIADPLFFKAMNHYGHRDIALAMRILGGFKNVLTRSVTTAPDFMFTNLLRDTAMGYLFSKSGMKPLVGSVKGLYDRLSNDPAYKEFILNGGGYASTVHGETKVMKRNLERMYEEAGIDTRAVLDTPAKLVRAWDEFNSAFEYGTRLNEYKRLRAKGVSAKEAAYQARDITTDFAMRGYSETVNMIIGWAPFMNAGMQGLYRLARGFTSTDVVKTPDGEIVGQTNPVQLTVKALAAITIPSLLLAWMNHDDDRYKALPDWIKDLHWVILLPKGTQERTGVPEIWLLPKPFEVGAIFASIPERSLIAFKDRDGKKYIDSLIWIIANQFRLEPWRIQAVAPLIETEATNRNFTGAPIVPEDLQNVEAFEQYTPFTSDTAKMIGKTFNVSPVKIEHWIRGYFGYMGMYAMMGTDALAGSEYGEKPEQTVDRYPVIRRFTRRLPLSSTSYSTDFYSMVKESRKVVETFNKMMRELRPEDASKYLADKGKETAYALGNQLDKMTKQVANIRSAMRTIRIDRTMSGKEKREKLDELQNDLNQAMEQAAKVLNRDEFKEFRDRVKLRR